MVTTCCNHNLPRAPLAVARLSSSQVIACLKSHPETPRPYGCQYARAYQQSYQNEFQRRAECGALSDHRWRDLSVDGWIEKGKQLFWNSTICAEAGLVNLLFAVLQCVGGFFPTCLCWCWIAGDFWRNRDNWMPVFLADCGTFSLPKCFSVWDALDAEHTCRGISWEVATG